ncbi:Voltage-dependent N-type calcium channel subunit alpha-1B [Symbiodinium microadriaticum]|uniref:Voltage-dependent N-type calcium channel subunit alpha-1B n=1 Tax=Symbiodinium microadriaticum TaxID=2951 RepID=A0A1Q9DSI4_SYMMI|nr:Voltage-dependent N-type calcium channel subunit alpha-1B [Symbiodinium microadriaticum]
METTDWFFAENGGTLPGKEISPERGPPPLAFAPPKKAVQTLGASSKLSQELLQVYRNIFEELSLQEVILRDHEYGATLRKDFVATLQRALQGRGLDVLQTLLRSNRWCSQVRDVWCMVAPPHRRHILPSLVQDSNVVLENAVGFFANIREQAVSDVWRQFIRLHHKHEILVARYVQGVASFDHAIKHNMNRKMSFEMTSDWMVLRFIVPPDPEQSNDPGTYKYPGCAGRSCAASDNPDLDKTLQDETKKEASEDLLQVLHRQDCKASIINPPSGSSPFPPSIEADGIIRADLRAHQKRIESMINDLTEKLPKRIESMINDLTEKLPCHGYWPSYDVKLRELGFVSYIQGSPLRRAGETRSKAIEFISLVFFEHPAAGAREYGTSRGDPGRRGYGEWCRVCLPLKRILLSWDWRGAYSMKRPEKRRSIVEAPLFECFDTFELMQLETGLLFFSCYNPLIHWNVLDFTLIAFAVVEEVLLVWFSGPSGLNLSVLRTLRMLRLARILRILKVVRFFSELRIMVNGVLGSAKSLFWALLLIILVNFLPFGVFFMQLSLNYLESVDSKAPLEFDAREQFCPSDSRLLDYFGSLPRTMMTLYQAISGGIDWGTAVATLLPVSEMLEYVFSA